MKRLHIISLVAASLILSTPAYATRYQCSPKQVFKWKEGSLIASDIPSNSSIIIDDITGAIYENEHVSAQRLKIVQKLHDDNAMVASLETTGSDYTSNLVLRIQHIDNDQQSHLAYTFYSDGNIQAGQCNIMPANQNTN